MSFTQIKPQQIPVLKTTITVDSLQFLMLGVLQVPAGRLEFTLTLYAVSSCLFHCPGEGSY